jgi:site-specific DNA-methyltransferase (adenine-specific)
MSHQRKSKIVTQKDEWGTPVWLWHLLRDEYNLVVDAACTPENALTSFSIGENSLTIPWVGLFGKVGFFLNPPYSAGNIDRFMQKAYEESQKGAVVVCLVPCATDTKWWHSYAMKAQEIRFIKGRVRFVGYDKEGKQIKQSPTFSSCVVIFRPQWSKDAARFVDPGRFKPVIGKTIEQPRSVKV